jgi:hypothetical protein
MEKIEWQAPEYIHKEKTQDWYWIVGIITISIVIISVVLNNIIFGILVAISAITLSLYATRKPQIVPIEINNVGIKINSTLHPFEELESFWIETRDAYPRIFLKSNKKIFLYIVIMLGNANPDEIRTALAEHLHETEHTEPFLEKLLFYFGF